MESKIRELKDKVIKNILSNTYYAVQYLEAEETSQELKDFILKNINWEDVSRSSLSEKFIEKYKDNLDFTMISEYSKLSEDFIEKYSSKLDWKMISMHQNLNKEYIQKNLSKLFPLCLGVNREISNVDKFMILLDIENDNNDYSVSIINEINFKL